ncbi:hypothetical protein T4C_4250 [Trichinella pseudospiralis]|uniref:Uncharacterized protein n=1 Tax=Trichinella pseudospiralis TaxID=6337 RepID=A0A0V1GF19_TRIPS|nr:hypothetical protein T4C_4250 [Trichinella pseudospiralis]
MENSSRGYNKILLSEQFDGQRILRTYENDQLETLYVINKVAPENAKLQ